MNFIKRLNKKMKQNYSAIKIKEVYF